jgi:3,4-dihydroxy 2-butanone 4-phosphate synthase/GTP cyclohydrolase II
MRAHFISGVDQQCSSTPSSLVSTSLHSISHGVRIPLVNRTIPSPALRSTSRGTSIRAQAQQSAPELPSAPPAFVAAIHAGRDLDTPAAGFDSIPDALAAIARGETVVVLDDEDRENEGDLILAADLVTPEAMAFMVEHTSGVICIGMEGADLDRLRIPLMIPPADNEEAMSTAFTVTVDLREGTTTGISASDRSATLSALASPSSTPEDFKRPGHIFPLRYRPGGVLRRPGHTEAAVDLSRLAGRAPAGVLCEIVNKDGTMARTPELLEFAARFGLKCITIADLVRYRLKHEPLVERVASGELPTRYGRFSAYAYRSLLDGTEHIALVVGNITSDNVLARVHSESMLGDVFGSERCDSGSQLDAALGHIADAGTGVLVYLRGQQGRGLGLADELKAYTAAGGAAEVCATPGALEDSSFPVDVRDYGVAAHILKDLNIGSVQLLTNNTTKLNCMKAHGIKATAVPLLPPSAANSHDAASNGKSAHGRRNGSEPHFV